MTMLSRSAGLGAMVLIALLAAPAAGQAPDEERPFCTEDAMIVFDASGSMSGNTVQGLFSDVTRIDEVRKALAQVLPQAAKHRKIGLITYGPGPYQQCNVQLDFPPIWNATEHIMSVVNALNPAGKTPLVAAVEQAVKVLEYPSKPGVVVLLTDGEETCGGAPCALGKTLKTLEALNPNSRLTVHVIGYQLKAFRWTGAQSFLDVKCLAEETGGLYITAENRQDLIKAFEKTLGCPMMSAVSAPSR
jgi:Ca-activated chloride channel family protein